MKIKKLKEILSVDSCLFVVSFHSSLFVVGVNSLYRALEVNYE